MSWKFGSIDHFVLLWRPFGLNQVKITKYVKVSNQAIPKFFCEKELHWFFLWKLAVFWPNEHCANTDTQKNPKKAGNRWSALSSPHVIWGNGTGADVKSISQIRPTIPWGPPKRLCSIIKYINNQRKWKQWNYRIHVWRQRMFLYFHNQTNKDLYKFNSPTKNEQKNTSWNNRNRISNKGYLIEPNIIVDLPIIYCCYSSSYSSSSCYNRLWKVSIARK